MKIENVYFSNINMNIEFHIGKSAQDNVDVIDLASPDDLWFHIKDDSSCHVVAILPEKVNKKELHTIVKKGALLCKQNTKKVASKNKTIEIIYTPIKNICKTEILGQVMVHTSKTIVL